jgi:hypothetical protein
MENPVVIFLLAVVLHFAADALPHWNIYPQNYSRFPYELVALDVIGGLLAAYAFVGNDIAAPPILAAIIGGNAPDVAHSLWFISGRRRPLPGWLETFFVFHDRIQFELPRPADGLISQAILVSAAAAAILII